MKPLYNYHDFSNVSNKCILCYFGASMYNIALSIIKFSSAVNSFMCQPVGITLLKVLRLLQRRLFLYRTDKIRRYQTKIEDQRARTRSASRVRGLAQD